MKYELFLEILLRFNSIAFNYGIATGLWIEVFILITGFGIGLPICHILEFID